MTDEEKKDVKNMVHTWFWAQLLTLVTASFWLGSTLSSIKTQIETRMIYEAKTDRRLEKLEPCCYFKTQVNK